MVPLIPLAEHIIKLTGERRNRNRSLNLIHLSIASCVHGLPQGRRVQQAVRVFPITLSEVTYHAHRLVASKSVELIGGADMYIAACRNCHQDKNVTSAAAPPPSPAKQAADSV